MKKAFPSNLLLVAIVASALTACVVVGPGDKADAVPPRLVKNNNNELTWDRPNAFGPVPVGLNAAGDAICKNIGSEKATGYHPKAEDINGKPINGGGYYCVGKSR